LGTKGLGYEKSVIRRVTVRLGLGLVLLFISVGVRGVRDRVKVRASYGVMM